MCSANSCFEVRAQGKHRQPCGYAGMLPLSAPSEPLLGHHSGLFELIASFSLTKHNKALSSYPGHPWGSPFIGPIKMPASQTQHRRRRCPDTRSGPMQKPKLFRCTYAKSLRAFLGTFTCLFLFLSSVLTGARLIFGALPHIYRSWHLELYVRALALAMANNLLGSSLHYPQAL